MTSSASTPTGASPAGRKPLRAVACLLHSQLLCSAFCSFAVFRSQALLWHGGFQKTNRSSLDDCLHRTSPRVVEASATDLRTSSGPVWTMGRKPSPTPRQFQLLQSSSDRSKTQESRPSQHCADAGMAVPSPSRSAGQAQPQPSSALKALAVIFVPGLRKYASQDDGRLRASPSCKHA